eukprot:CAMPEP_0201972330 /NCGR_PEP_ID=MMETSP0904-20121228/41280_1 /ASSEMBLY_ACC=CAM_ASM_000553 /TAXON_ID=420261 /ORGANISM="Thalassiosira antarctica, Strain CCMP982" /LENGTH=214 /DNA_ID=CAMNT_0048522123 /DNA_START=46 /DNA_END=691 /DNA_ORIENTATION=-
MTPPSLLITLTTLLLLASLLLSLPTTHASASCNVVYEATCDSVNFTATSNVFFYVNHTESNKDVETYNATVIFHWDIENITESSKPYKIGDPFGLSNTFEYTNEGYYEAGYSIIFDDDAAAGCSKKNIRIIESFKDGTDAECGEWGAVTPKPTMTPSVSMGPTVSFSPTNALVVNIDGGNGVGDGSNGVDEGVVVCRFGLVVVGLAAAVGSLLF